MCAQLLFKEACELLKEAGNTFAFSKEAGAPFVVCKEAADLSKEAEKKQVKNSIFCFFSASFLLL